MKIVKRYRGKTTVIRDYKLGVLFSNPASKMFLNENAYWRNANYTHYKVVLEIGELREIRDAINAQLGDLVGADLTTVVKGREE
jgi:hypothetical protein